MSNFIPLNIRYLCSEFFFTQKEFGELFDTKQSTIGSYISGRTEPSISTMNKICEYFKITLDELVNSDLSKAPKKKDNSTGIVSEPSVPYCTDAVATVKDEMIAILKKDVEELRNDKQLLQDLVKAKYLEK